MTHTYNQFLVYIRHISCVCKSAVFQLSVTRIILQFCYFVSSAKTLSSLVQHFLAFFCVVSSAPSKVLYIQRSLPGIRDHSPENSWFFSICSTRSYLRGVLLHAATAPLPHDMLRVYTVCGGGKRKEKPRKHGR